MVICGVQLQIKRWGVGGTLLVANKGTSPLILATQSMILSPQGTTPLQDLDTALPQDTAIQDTLPLLNIALLVVVPQDTVHLNAALQDALQGMFPLQVTSPRVGANQSFWSREKPYMQLAIRCSIGAKYVKFSALARTHLISTLWVRSMQKC